MFYYWKHFILKQFTISEADSIDHWCQLVAFQWLGRVLHSVSWHEIDDKTQCPYYLNLWNRGSDKRNSDAMWIFNINVKMISWLQDALQISCKYRSVLIDEVCSVVKGIVTANPNAIVLALLPMQHSTSDQATKDHRRSLEDRLGQSHGCIGPILRIARGWILFLVMGLQWLTWMHSIFLASEITPANCRVFVDNASRGDRSPHAPCFFAHRVHGQFV